MYNILLVLCGGTICSAVNETDDGTYRSISDDAISLLTDNYYHSDSPFKENVEFIASENFRILSENMTVDKWNELIQYFQKESSFFNKYDGIIVAHGTDTLAYSSALFSLLLRNIGIPVIFVSSNEPLTSPKANGNENFRKAVECICLGITPNVYAVYKNPSSGRMLLHLASRLTQCKNYSEDFYSEGGIDISDLTDNDYSLLFNDIKVSNSATLSLDKCPDLHNCVLKIDPYVGLDYQAFDYSRFRAVLHGTYHSGTACAEKTKDSPNYSTQSILHLLDICPPNVNIFLSPAKNTGEVYDSVGIISNHSQKKVHFLYGCTNEMTYVKLLLAYALDVSDVDAFVHTEFNGENQA